MIVNSLCVYAYIYIYINIQIYIYICIVGKNSFTSCYYFQILTAPLKAHTRVNLLQVTHDTDATSKVELSTGKAKRSNVWKLWELSKTLAIDYIIISKSESISLVDKSIVFVLYQKIIFTPLCIFKNSFVKAPQQCQMGHPCSKNILRKIQHQTKRQKYFSLISEVLDFRVFKEKENSMS